MKRSPALLGGAPALSPIQTAQYHCGASSKPVSYSSTRDVRGPVFNVGEAGASVDTGEG